MKWIWAVITAVAVIGGGIGCGKGPDGLLPDGGGGDPDAAPAPDAPDEPSDLATMCGGTVPTTPAEWERCFLKRHCEMRVHCGEHNLYTDVAECIALFDAVNGGKLAFEAAERERAIAAGRASLDVAKFTECLIEQSPKRCGTAAKAVSCATRYTGTIADNQTCYADAECRSPGARCEAQLCQDSCCAGTCVPRKKLTEMCDDFDACEPGLVCSLTSATCVAGDIGVECNGRYDCDPGAWCDAGTCKADLAPGTKCDSILQCGGETSCVGLRRAVEPPTCRRITQLGDACDWYCFGNMYCDLSNPTGWGTCRELPGLNEGCGALFPCVGHNNRCSESTCVARAGINQACVDGTCLPGLFCSDQVGETSPVCRERLPDGQEACNRPSQCRSYVCDADPGALGECQPALPTCP